MENSGNLSAQESFGIITGMINEAKGHIRQNSFYYLLWGWTVTLAHLGMFILFQTGYEHPYITWAITVPAWIVTLIRVFTSERKKKVRTHFDSISVWLWLSFGVSIFSLASFGWKLNYQLTPVILLVTAIPTVVSGVILKFTPLKIGGFIFWLAGIISFLLPMEFQSLAGAVAIICGYLIPGYMLKSQKQM
jgi:hypothetical protein